MMTPEQVRTLAVPVQTLDVASWSARWPNFPPEEVACRGTGRIPDPARCPQFVGAMDGLQALRDHFGVPLVVNSGYRTPEHNRSIKGAAKRSKHLLGIAFDVSIPNLDPHAVEAKAQSLGFKGIGRYPNPGGARFIHIDTRPERARWGKPWPENADRFDQHSENPDGVEGLLTRLKLRVLAWVGGGGSVAVVAEHFTDAINRAGDVLSRLPVPDWRALLIFAGVVLAGVALFTIFKSQRDERYDRDHEYPENPIDDQLPKRGDTAHRVQRAVGVLDPNRGGRRVAIPAPSDPRRYWTD